VNGARGKKNPTARPGAEFDANSGAISGAEIGTCR